MNKKMVVVLILMLTSIFLIACTNPQGGFGPSWDVGLQVPLTRDHRFEITDLITGEGLDLTGEVISFSGEDQIETMELGSYITDISLPNTQLLIEEMTLDNLVSIDTVVSNVSGGMVAAGPYTYTYYTDTDISPTFSDLTFSSDTVDDDGNTVNELLISVAPPTGVTVDSMTVELFTGDGSGGEVSLGTVTITAPSTSGVLGLISKSFNSYIKVEVSGLETSGTGGPGDLTLNLSIPRAEVGYISGFDLSSPILVDTGSLDIDLGVSEYFLHSITFAGGTLDLGVSSSDSNLNIDFNDVNIGGLTHSGGSNNISIDLSNQSLDLNGSVTADLDLSISGTNITFDTVTFTADFTNPVVSAVSAEFNITDFSSMLPVDFADPTITLPDDQGIKDMLNKITLNDLNVNLVINNNTGIDTDQGELVVDLSTIEFVAKDSNGTRIDSASFALGDIDSDAANIGRGTNKLALINTTATTDFLDLLYTYPASVEVLLKKDGSSGGFSVNSGGYPVTITDQSNLEFAFEYSMGLDITLNESIEATYYEREGFNGFSEDQLQNKVFKSARLVVEDFDNQMPFELKLYFYIAQIDNHSSLSDTQFEEALFQETNKLSNSLVIESRTAGPVDKEIVLLDESILDKFTGDNLFFGLKFIIPEGQYRFETDDCVEVGDIYSNFIFKVNQ